MKLEWIKSTACPDCGETEIVEEGISFTKVFLSGDRKDREYRRFKCGRQAENDNNKYRDEFVCRCEQSAAYKKFVARKKDIVDAVRQALAGKGLKRDAVDDMVHHIDFNLHPSNFMEEKKDGE